MPKLWGVSKYVAKINPLASKLASLSASCAVVGSCKARLLAVNSLVSGTFRDLHTGALMQIIQTHPLLFPHSDPGNLTASPPEQVSRISPVRDYVFGCLAP